MQASMSVSLRILLLETQLQNLMSAGIEIENSYYLPMFTTIPLSIIQEES